ncbi:MAG: hypothetical protein M3Z46_01610 [Actinomycetota bacterium]|nr:hypothetical protein [Actinomycetota bacterium]
MTSAPEAAAAPTADRPAVRSSSGTQECAARHDPGTNHACVMTARFAVTAAPDAGGFA